MRNVSTGAACAVAAMLAGGCSEPAPAAEGVTTAEIKDGFIWDPWTQTTQTWTRNVVKLPGCTGTLLDYEWVMSAAHCFDRDQDPSTITVKHTLEGGVVEQTVGVELLFHPLAGAVDDEGNTQSVDVALVRLRDPMVASPLPIVDGTTADLVGQTVFCAGYGATDTGGACDSSADCESGEFCRWGVCMTSNDGRLRAASFQIIADPIDANIWYRFQVPNALGQLELPGDSGSSCWNGQGLTGVMKAGNPSNYNRQTSGPAARAWIESVVTPAILKQVNAPGAACKAVGGAALDYDTDGDIMNTSAAARTVLCPITRPLLPAFADVVSVPRVWVYDRSTAADVCCTVQSKNAGGALVESEPVCSQGSDSGYQTLVLPSVRDGFTFSHASVSCTLPATGAAGSSGVIGYRAKLADR